MADRGRKNLKKSKTISNINTEKLERRNIQEQQRRIKPGECLKYVKTIIDPEFLAGQFGSKVLPSLVNLGIKYEIRAQVVPRTISWERSEQQTLISSEEAEKYVPEKEIMLLMLGEETAKSIADKTLSIEIKQLKEIFQDSPITLIIFGLKNYLKCNTTSLKRKDIEYSFTEIQVLYNCNHRLLETANDVAAAVAQFSKAVAEIPFKKQHSEKFTDANCFLLNDNKDCVRVEGSAGLPRLWQQHLTRLPMVTLETAEAIMNAYPKPKLLFEEFERSPDAENILAELQVRRAGGPLSSVRRVGPLLSRKIHTLYTSLDPNEIL